jgi:hypothetical protein
MGCAVLSKCANPECSQQFRYLHQGKLFCLTPTPDVAKVAEGAITGLYERFWLCDPCSKTMTLAWAGTHIKVVPLPTKPALIPAALSAQAKPALSRKRLVRAASRGR